MTVQVIQPQRCDACLVYQHQLNLHPHNQDVTLKGEEAKEIDSKYIVKWIFKKC